MAPAVAVVPGLLTKEALPDVVEEAGLPEAMVRVVEVGTGFPVELTLGRPVVDGLPAKLDLAPDVDDDSPGFADPGVDRAAVTERDADDVRPPVVRLEMPLEVGFFSSPDVKPAVEYPWSASDCDSLDAWDDVVGRREVVLPAAGRVGGLLRLEAPAAEGRVVVGAFRVDDATLLVFAVVVPVAPGLLGAVDVAIPEVPFLAVVPAAPGAVFGTAVGDFAGDDFVVAGDLTDALEAAGEVAGDSDTTGVEGSTGASVGASTSAGGGVAAVISAMMVY